MAKMRNPLPVQLAQMFKKRQKLQEHYEREWASGNPNRTRHYELQLEFIGVRIANITRQALEAMPKKSKSHNKLPKHT